MKDFDAMNSEFDDETTLAEVESMVFTASGASLSSSLAAAGEKYLETFSFILFMKILNFQAKAKEGNADTYDDIFLALHVCIQIYK